MFGTPAIGSPARESCIVTVNNQSKIDGESLQHTNSYAAISISEKSDLERVFQKNWRMLKLIVGG